MTDNEIMQADQTVLLSAEFLSELYYGETAMDKIDQARQLALATVRAKQCGLEKQFTNVLKAYTAAEKKMASYHTAEAAKRSSGDLQLDYDGKGQPLVTIENFYKILKSVEPFTGLKYNELKRLPEIEFEGKISNWEDSDDCDTRRIIEKTYKIHNKEKYSDAMRIVLCNNSYHPIRNLISATQWDKAERIETLLIKWLKVEDTEYTREVTRLIFAGGINRLYSPGCKFDDVPVLIGTNQGEGKSTFVRWLALRDDWFGEVTNVDGDAAAEALDGLWICEISELMAMTRAKDVESVKSFITRTNDRRRPKYGVWTQEYPRQCIFVGTTNKEQFLTDKTGNRRFYPLKTNSSGYDLFDHEEEIKADILQCWAEAKAKYDSGNMKPFADRKIIGDIKRKQAEAVEDDPMEGIIDDYIEHRDEICVLQLWKYALGNEYSKPTKKDSSEISLIMQGKNEWAKMPSPKKFDQLGSQRYWRRKTSIISGEEKIEDIFG